MTVNSFDVLACPRLPMFLVLLLALAPNGGCSSASSTTAAETGLDAADVAAPSDSSAEAALDGAADVPTDTTDTMPSRDKDGCYVDPGPGSTGIEPATYATLKPADFKLSQALAGFSTPLTSSVLKARFTTELGTITCILDDKLAPISVANFVGLARATRPFRSGTTWKLGRFYDGLIFHRVIPDFVIQGGDPRGTGSGGPGYSIPVENQVAEPLGTLAMAAAAEPSGSQFYIVVGTGPAPDYNVFGACETAVAVAISKVDRSSKDMPLTPIHMQKVDILVCPK